MNELEKVRKAFNQCSDALSGLDHQSIERVFRLLSVHFEFDPNSRGANSSYIIQNEPIPHLVESAAVVANEVEVSKSTPKKAQKQSNGSKGKGQSTTSRTLTPLNNINFRPDGIETLKDFFSGYAAKSNLDYNLIILYWFQEKSKDSPITINHVLTAYRHLNLKIPNLKQSLVDTKSRKGWIESGNNENLKVTREGLNYIEHDMPKKNG